VFELELYVLPPLQWLERRLLWLRGCFCFFPVALLDSYYVPRCWCACVCFFVLPLQTGLVKRDVCVCVCFLVVVVNSC